jgi:hypothetical protein
MASTRPADGPVQRAARAAAQVLVAFAGAQGASGLRG